MLNLNQTLDYAFLSMCEFASSIKERGCLHVNLFRPKLEFPYILCIMDFYPG